MRRLRFPIASNYTVPPRGLSLTDVVVVAIAVPGILLDVLRSVALRGARGAVRALDEDAQPIVDLRDERAV